MSYIDRLKSAKTIEDLYTLREELKKESDALSPEWRSNTNVAALDKIQEIGFFIRSIESQINYLQSKGIFLAEIKLPETS